MNKCILDSSALLAFINKEPGYIVVEGLLSTSIMSSVNVAEVIAELNSKINIPIKECQIIVTTLLNQIVPFDLIQASLAGRLKQKTIALGLSLGDRSCLALGLHLNLPVYTADQVWGKLKIDCKIHLIR